MSHLTVDSPEGHYFTSAILRELGEVGSRRAAARELTSLLERHESFSFLRVGDGEIQWVRALQGGGLPPRYRYSDKKGASVEQVFSVSGMENRHFDRFMNAVRRCTYLDHCDNIPANFYLLPTIGIHRSPNQYSNPSPETANIIFEWAWFELKNYVAEHRCLFASAEAGLMRELSADPRYQRLAAQFWPANREVYFHQIRDDGRNFSENLDRIKEDLREDISVLNIDTMFLSLASGAKVLCYELAEEMGIRCIDFGSMTRALTYAASPGYHAHRNFHNPFMFRVPLDVFMPALERAHPTLPLPVLIAKAQGQVLLDLQDLRPLAFNPSDACRGGTVNLSEEALANFWQSLSYYNHGYRSRALHDPESRQLHAEFVRWRRKKGLGLDGSIFLFLVRCKQTARRLVSKIFRPTVALG